jgi:hypothetical protein
MRWFKVRKAEIAPQMRDTFEQAGPSIVQTLMFSGMINSAGLPPALKRVSEDSEERKAALAWLTEKADQAERRHKFIVIGIWAGIIAAIASAIAAWPTVREWFN